MKYRSLIGLEVHAQLKTASKLFCSCRPVFGAEPNALTCPVCLGLPGALPVMNERALEFGIAAALALNCRIASETRMDRKHYYYPDLPKNYQTSQYDRPFSADGYLDVFVGDAHGNGRMKRVAVERIHLEEDAGKLVHAGGESLADLNRAGTPLIEIVTKHTVLDQRIETPEEAYAYLTELKTVLEYLGICDCNMQEGSLRCDANVSISPEGSDELGVKTEIKNMNSFSGVRAALEYEIERQKRCLAEGRAIVQETRLFDAEKNVTRSMRSKEYAHDYRYFPCPDLVPIRISAEKIAAIGEALPELPLAKRKRFGAEYGLGAYDIGVLTASAEIADYFEAAARLAGNPKLVANWVQGEMLRELNADPRLAVGNFPVTPAMLAELVELVATGTLSNNQAREVYAEMLAGGGAPAEIGRRRGFGQISDVDELERIVDAAITDNPGVVEQIRGGKDKAIGALMGRVMKETGGKANANIVSEMFRKKILG